jgi:hypothetical protein
MTPTLIAFTGASFAFFALRFGLRRTSVFAAMFFS